MRLCFTATAVLFAFTCTVVHADHPSRKGLADKHAPAGIMGDHLHQKGEWMVEYKYMVMSMEDNRIGETTVSDQDAIGPAGAPAGIVVDGIQTNAGATPTQMTMEMHMAHIMYGASDDVTLYTMLMMPALTMDHIRGDGNPPAEVANSRLTTVALATPRWAHCCDCTAPIRKTYCSTWDAQCRLVTSIVKRPHRRAG